MEPRKIETACDPQQVTDCFHSTTPGGLVNLIISDLPDNFKEVFQHERKERMDSAENYHYVITVVRCQWAGVISCLALCKGAFRIKEAIA